jgi:hypothetical protein
MNTKIFIGIALATAAIAVSCAPANARTSSQKPQRTYETTPEPMPSSSPVTEVQGTKAQLPTTSRVFEYSLREGKFKVEFLSCNKSGDAKANVVCSFTFTNLSDTDFVINDYYRNMFRVFDSAGTPVVFDSGKKGTGEWQPTVPEPFLAQFPISIKVKFQLPASDTKVTFLDVIGKVTTRFSQVPIDPQ